MRASRGVDVGLQVLTGITTTTQKRGLPDEAQMAALSRHAGAQNFRWDIDGHNVNSWCQIPGNPFMGQFVLMPNGIKQDPVSVVFGPVNFPEGLDTLTFFPTSQGRVHHNTIALRVEVLDGSHTCLGQKTVLVRHGDESVASVRFRPPPSGRVALRFTAAFEAFEDPSNYGNVRLPYMVAYTNNKLVDLFNAAGSDKGTEVFFGGGVPHCYALDYHRIFQPLRDDTFNMLEIGLENASKEDGNPVDAPSLRAWREYFPNATLFGYDINDFSFFEQERTATFQGDQSSPDDIQRFLQTHGRPQFGVILDDGSHASSHQQISFAKLFDSVRPGGMYVIEDLQWQPYPEAATTLEVLTKYLDTGKIISPFISAADAQTLEQSISELRIYKPNDAEFAVIRKRA